MRGFREWMRGRKTYALAVALAAVTLVLVACGRLTPTTALAVLLVAACGFPATFRSALKRHQAEELALLGQLVAVGAAVSDRNLALVRVLGPALAESAAGLCGQIHDDCNQPPEIP